MSNDAPGIRQDPTLRLSRDQEMRLRHADITADDGVSQAHLLVTAQPQGGVLPDARCVVTHKAASPLIPSCGWVLETGHRCYLLAKAAPSRPPRRGRPPRPRARSETSCAT